ncbi:MAG: GNAT family N-acetyltransferase [Armatimonadetes bacterium]|nr:GNAT family N-acetyltransferase [Armatimonadota bacterium]MDE2205992.1 GNAT family N-acetyltransferase [Armatimonadota bacterium]
MDVTVERVEFEAVQPMRELYRHEAGCQIIHYSALPRKLADPWQIAVDGRPAGYAGIWNKYDPGRLMEFYLLPHLRAEAAPIFRQLLQTSGATEMEAQTNLPLMLLMFLDCVPAISVENVLFYDALTTSLPSPGGTFRRAATDGEKEHGEWLIEVNGESAAWGGALYHYNEPYGDIFMATAEAHRRRGYGSYLVQEVKRETWQRGKTPSARCNADNLASRRTLQKAGMWPCGRLLTGKVKST